MSRQWIHRVSPEWLKARKGVITATDVVKLMPEYKRWKKAGNPDTLLSGFAALWCEKESDRELDPTSVGAAARGHICEPWAIDSWCQQNGKQMFHWDDCLIRNGRIGFSPDALDIIMRDGTVTWDVAEDNLVSLETGEQIDTPEFILEVKSYEPAHHMKSCIADKMDHDELMQLAVAMYVCESIKRANLIFFCPGAPISMKEFSYTREDLKEQIELVDNVYSLWLDQSKRCQELVDQAQELNALCTEDEIWQSYLMDSTSDAVAQENVFLLRM